MGKHLVLIADSANARIMELDGHKLGQLGNTLQKSSMIANFDKGSAKPGRVKNGQSSSHSYAPHSDIHQVEKNQFLKEVARYLNNGLSNMDSLVLVAPAHALGELRKQLSSNVLSRVSHEIAKDLTKLKPDELISYVSKPYH